LISILDIGIGNTASVLNMVRRAGGDAKLSSSPEHVRGASAVILPGVGAFDHGMRKLNESGLLDALESEVIGNKLPFLGICLGMQLLFEKSDEGQSPGLGWLAGTVTKFDFTSLGSEKRLKVPHMGWNCVQDRDRIADESLSEQNRFYFVHSFHVNCKDESDVEWTANHGYEFPCAVRRGNIRGVQFHPEKSHRFGVSFFRKFIEDTYA
jgi:glutamine amidotransferase